ncbi:MAG: hypothetical protein WAX69_16910 [Victivallales bacterium]
MMDNEIKKALMVELLNLHPYIVWGLIIIDTILCIMEIFSWGISYFLSIIISVLFGIFTFFTQVMSCGDSLETATAKGALACLLVLTPTSILSMLYMVLYLSRKQKMR